MSLRKRIIIVLKFPWWRSKMEGLLLPLRALSFKTNNGIWSRGSFVILTIKPASLELKVNTAKKTRFGGSKNWKFWPRIAILLFITPTISKKLEKTHEKSNLSSLFSKLRFKSIHAFLQTLCQTLGFFTRIFGFLRSPGSHWIASAQGDWLAQMVKKRVKLAPEKTKSGDMPRETT